MTIFQAVLLGVAGLGAGVIAEFVGVGGGVIFTPTLFAAYGVLEVPPGVRTPLTVGTGLFCTGLAAGTSAFHRARRGAVAERMALGIGLASAVAVGLVPRCGGASHCLPSWWPDGWCGERSDGKGAWAFGSGREGV